MLRLSSCLIVATVILVGLAASALPDEPARATAIVPQTVTMKGQGLPLRGVLVHLTKQTGISVRDARAAKNEAKLNLDLNRATFWQAVDAIAAEVKCSVSPYQRDGGVALVDGAPPIHVSHANVFRSAVKQVRLTQNLETGFHSCAVSIEVVWEPWLQPFLVGIRDWSAEFAPDAKGKVIRLDKQMGTGLEEAVGRTGVELDLRLPAPERSSPQLARLTGALTVVTPVKMLTVKFEDLEAARTKAQIRTPEDGITVTLNQLTSPDKDHWQAEIKLSYPAGGPNFESFRMRSWLANNRIYLEKKSSTGKVRFLPKAADEQIERQDNNTATIQYHFFESPKDTPRLGSPSDWALIYVTPGRIVEATVPFEFKNLPLP